MVTGVAGSLARIPSRPFLGTKGVTNTREVAQLRTYEPEIRRGSLLIAPLGLLQSTLEALPIQTARQLVALSLLIIRLGNHRRIRDIDEIADEAHDLALAANRGL